MYSIDYDEYGNPVSGTYLGGGVGSVGGGGSLGAGPKGVGGGASTPPAGGSYAGTGGPLPPVYGGEGGAPSYGGDGFDNSVPESATPSPYTDSGNEPIKVDYMPNIDAQGNVQLTGPGVGYEYAPDVDRSALTMEPGGRFLYDPDTGIAVDAARYDGSMGDPVQMYLRDTAVWDVNNPFKEARIVSSVPQSIFDQGNERALASNNPNYYAAASNTTMLTPYGDFTPAQAQAMDELRSLYEKSGYRFDRNTREWRPSTAEEYASELKYGTWRGPENYDPNNPTLINA